MLTCLCLKWKLVRCDSSDITTTCGDLPKNQTTRIHVNPEESISRKVDGTLQNFRCHVPPGSHLAVRIANNLVWFELQGQTKVPNTGCSIRSYQHILGFKVTVGNCGFYAGPTLAWYFCVQMCQTAGNSQA